MSTIKKFTVLTKLRVQNDLDTNSKCTRVHMERNYTN